MGIKRHQPEEIVTKLRQVEVLCGQGMARVDAIREVQITEQTFYRWRKQYAGMGTDQLRELKRLQEETLQHQATPQCFGLPPTSPGNHRHDGDQADHALTFKLDHSGEADQSLTQMA